jgi:ubiquinone/menaquinone biosynthesis C-methylase UbiE
MSEGIYLHGYSEWEQERLIQQNDILSKYIYQRIDLAGKKRLLEVGCGVGAQMIYMLNKYPELHITGLELEEKQLEKAAENLRNAGIPENRFSLIQGNATRTGWETLQDFDAVVMIWVLEHIPDCIAVLRELKRVLRPGTEIWITEVYHQGFATYPTMPSMQNFWQKMIQFQSQTGGDANIGLRLGQLLHSSGIHTEWVSPFPMIFDARNPGARNEMFLYWKDLMYSSIDSMEQNGYSVKDQWIQVENELNQLLQDPDSVFYYSFIQAKSII